MTKGAHHSSISRETLCVILRALPLPRRALLPGALPILLFAAGVCAQPAQREPHIGYVYPAGGQQGTTIEVTVGGQNLRDADYVIVSGGAGGLGVTGEVVEVFRPLNNQQMQEIRKKVNERLDKDRPKRLGPGKGSAAGKGPEAGPAPTPAAGSITPLEEPPLKAAEKGPAEIQERNLGRDVQATGKAANDKNAIGNAGKDKNKDPRAEVPDDHPILRQLEAMSPGDLQYMMKDFFDREKRQPNAQIAEMALVRLTIAPGAAPGDRELRLGTPVGLTNPLRFQVGQMPEFREREPNNPDWPEARPIEIPAVLNGQILPGDTDRFRFHAREGQNLVIDVRARQLMPYLADAVPGWFQAVVSIYDAAGNEVAYADDYRFHPDPVLFFQVPRDGDYDLEIRDSIFRGREDFVYRIAVGEQPFITGLYPLGAREGAPAASAWITGWNLASKKARLGTAPGGEWLRTLTVNQENGVSNTVSYAVDSPPDAFEKEPNNAPNEAQKIALPLIINGCIDQPGDKDVFEFAGRAGDEVVAEVFARRLQSPLDSLLRLTDAQSRVLAWNDDHEDKAMGLETHHADSYLRVKLPADGKYFVAISDAQRHGGNFHVYRLRIGPPRLDFALRVTPSSVTVPAGRTAPICVHVVRKDGFDGAVDVYLKDAPRGFSLQGARIPAGRDSIRMTLSAPRMPLPNAWTALHIEGRAEIDGIEIVRPAVPAEDMMQAFAYRHLVPSREFIAAIPKAKRGGPPVEIASPLPIRIPANGAAQVTVRAPFGGARGEGGARGRQGARGERGGRGGREGQGGANPGLQNIQLELSDPPEGISIGDVSVVQGGMTFSLKAEGKAAQAGLADNLIVEAFTEIEGKTPEGKPDGRKRRMSVGVLPAIPIQVISRQD